MIIDIKVPSPGESVTEVTIGKILVQNGETVAIDQVICEIESDKATLEVGAEAAGVLTLTVKEGDDIAIGTVIGTINTAANGQQETPPPTDKPKETTQAPANLIVAQTAEEDSSYAEGHPSPAALKLMEENGIKASDIKGSGADGRITKQDILLYLEAKKNELKNTATEKTETPPPPPVKTETTTPIPGTNRTDRREKMTRLRKTISQRLVSAKNNTAMLTTFNEVDLTEVMAMRSRYKEVFEKKHGIGLGFMSFFSKACAIALTDFPGVNAYIIDDVIEYHDYVDISIAVSTPKGLVVPVIRNVQDMGFKEIELAVKELAVKGRDGLLTMEDMTGGTFTITNGGVFGSLLSTPILNPPQSAILGMHKIQERPMVINGQIVARPMMYLALSYDHRIIDGKEAVSFLVRVKELLEDPMKLFLNL